MEGAPRAGNAFSIVNMLFRGAETLKNDSLNLLNFFKVSGCNQFILATFK